MLFVNCVAWPWLAMLALTSAETTTTTTAATASTSKSTATSTESSRGAATHTIQVGPKEDPHQYVPANITADAGDVVVFEFYPTNHSVVKADYMAPCVPASGEFFYSGPFDNFNENNGQLVGPAPTWSLIINDTEPTFFYCTAIDSCMVNGMVGVINPNDTMTWEAQYEKAKEYPYMLVPGQSMPAEGNRPGDETDGSDESNGGGSSGLGGGAIAGIVVGAVAFVAILVALFFVLGRNRVYQKWMTSQDGRTERTARWALFNAHSEPREMDSATQPSGDHPMYASSPDPTQRSSFPSPPQQSGHWSWKFQQPMSFQQPNPTAPTELEATSMKTDMRGTNY